MRIFFLTLLLCSLSPFLDAKRTVYIVPFDGCNVAQFFFDPLSERDGVARPFCALREQLEASGYAVRFVTAIPSLSHKQAATSVLISLNQIHIPGSEQIPHAQRLLFVFEPPVVKSYLYDPSLTRQFGKIFVMLDDLVDNKRYFKFHYPQPFLHLLNPSSIPFQQRKLCTSIAGNKNSSHPQSLYEERRKAIRFFTDVAPQEFDLYGTGWQGWKNWKGTVPQKGAVLRKYKFCICYENMKDQVGYITEKIFDALVAGTVPIYWGASNITDYVPADCFIDRRQFASDAELYQYLTTIDEQRYNQYLTMIESYLRSPQAQRFSSKAFVELICQHVAKAQP